MNKIIYTTKDELHNVIITALDEHAKKTKTKKVDRLRSVNYVAKTLGLAHNTVKKLLAKELIKSTKSGLIKDSEIKNYLENK